MTAETVPTVLHVQTDEPDSVTANSVGSLRRMARVAGYQYAAAGGLDHLVIGEFDTVKDAVEAAAALAPGSGRAAQVNVFRQLSPPAGWLTAAGVQTGPERPRGTTVLSVIMDVDADHLADFHGWYDEEHLPKLVAVPGILCALRYEAVGRDGGRPRFLAWYEMARQAVVESQEFAAASVLTPRTAAVTAHLDWASQLYVER